MALMQPLPSKSPLPLDQVYVIGACKSQGMLGLSKSAPEQGTEGCFGIGKACGGVGTNLK